MKIKEFFSEIWPYLILLTIIIGLSIYHKSEHQSPIITDTVYINKKYTDFELVTIAIIWQESKGNSNAVNNNAVGIFQITPIYVKEVNRILGYNKFSHRNAFSDTLSHEMFKLVQEYYNKEKSVSKAIKMHNPTAGNWYYNQVLDKYLMLKYLNNYSYEYK